MPFTFDVVGAYKQTWTTGAVTTIAAGTSSAGFLFSKRWVSTTLAYRLRSLEVEFLLTTAFGAAQEVGFDVFKATGYSAAPTGATAITIGADGKKKASYPSSAFSGTGCDVRIANTGALTAGTATLDGQAVARGSLWAGAVGTAIATRYFDFTTSEPGGLILSPSAAAANSEGLIIRNTILMGASGVGKWHFTFEWDEGIVT